MDCQQQSTDDLQRPCSGLNRRHLLLGAAGLAFGGLVSRYAIASGLPPGDRPDSTPEEPPASAFYGSLRPVRDETTGLCLLALPPGFRYLSFGWTGDRMSDGRPTPGLHDGMAVVAADGDTLTLIRNHELTAGEPFASVVYDPLAGGGTTTLTFDARRGQWLESFASLSGTTTNCAGGPTPWGSWLSCEENTTGPELDPALKTHGWVFEVPASGQASAEPLRAMGRFKHEAVAVDPATGICYLTEDQLSSGFYRFLPVQYGRLDRGGRLQMLRVTHADNIDLSAGYPNDTRWSVSWVDIDDPEQVHAPGTRNGQGVFAQGWARGGARLARGEGCWHDSGLIYFTATTGGAAGLGQVFEYDPAREQLRLVFESPGAAVLDAPDNIAVSPRGGIVLCEDGARQRMLLHGLTRAGEIFPFAENNVVLQGERNGLIGNFTQREWCGACFYGEWLFVNIQTPGITFAITGDWDNGPL